MNILGIIAGYGQYYIPISGQGTAYYVNEAVRTIYTNSVTSGPMFTQKIINGTYVIDKVIGFTAASRPLENLGSRLLGIFTCFTNGVFDITSPACLVEYKCRMINDYYGSSAADISTFGLLSALFTKIYNDNNNIYGTDFIVSQLGYNNSLLQPAMYSKWLTLVDLAVSDYSSVNASSPFYAFPANLDFTLT